MSTINQTKGMGFADQLPAPDPMPGGSLNPRSAEYAKYREAFFDPKYDGFGPELEFICDLPFRPSKEVKSSPWAWVLSCWTIVPAIFLRRFCPSPRIPV